MDIQESIRAERESQTAEDAGPIVFCIAIDRYGHANIAQGPLMVGREVSDINLLITGLKQVLDRAYDARREAERAEWEKSRAVAVLPSTNGHHAYGTPGSELIN